MATEWTKQEYEVAMDQRDELFPGFGECSGDPETEETAEKMLDLLCQGNRALAALKAIVPLLDSDLDAVKEWQDEAQQVHAAIAACEKGDA